MESIYFKKCLVCNVKDKENELRCKRCSGKLSDIQRILIDSKDLREDDERSKKSIMLTLVSPFIVFAFIFILLNPILKYILGLTPFTLTGTLIISMFFIGAGHIYSKRYLPGLFYAVMIPFSIGLVNRTYFELDLSFIEILSNNELNFGVITLIFIYIEIWLFTARDAQKGKFKQKKAPCHLACPAGIDIPDYISLISEGKYDYALNLIREQNPLPAVIGRVCPHPCQTDCIRGIDGEALSINYLKRFVSDYERAIEKLPPKFEVLNKKNEKVAIIGSGPAGLSAAYYLARLGVMSTIYERLEVPGGMLAVGIPKYRLPRDVLQYEIDIIKNLGVKIETNSPVGADGKSISNLLVEGYDAVLIAVGAQSGAKLRIEGEENDGVYDCLSFLKDANLKETKIIGRKGIVVGGGNAAIDAARMMMRLGAESVTVLYRRSRNEMPASPDEVRAAEEEGVLFEFLAAPTKIIAKENRVSAMECIKMRLGEPDSSGRRRPVPIEGSDFTINADTVIAAIGQMINPDFLTYEEKISFTGRNLLKTDRVSFKTSIDKVYSAGDCVSGPSTAINAIAMGKKAALSIFYDFYSKKIKWPDYKDNSIKKCEIIDVEKAIKKLHIRMPSLSPKDRACTFNEVEKGYSEGMALEESLRCLKCHQELIE